MTFTEKNRISQREKRDKERIEKFKKYKFIRPSFYHKLSSDYIDTWMDMNISKYSFISTNVVVNDFLREELHVELRGGKGTQYHHECKYNMNRVFKNQITRLLKKNKIEKYSNRNYKVL